MRPILLVALAACVALVAGCGTGDEQVTPQPTRTTVDPTAALRIDVARLEAELVKSNLDQQDLRAQVRRLAERASRSTRAPRVVVPATGDVWWRLALCESGGNAAANTGNNYYGAFQFNLATWRSNGGTGYPHEHSYDAQLAIAKVLQSRRGWSPWPSCSRRLGLR